MKKDDEVVGVEVIKPDESELKILTVTSKGYGKRTAPEEYRIQSRGGKGILTMKTTEKTGEVIGTKVASEEDDLMLVTSKGQTLRTRVREIRETGRVAQGVRLINVREDEEVKGIELLSEAENEDA